MENEILDLDLKDKKILFELDKNSRISITELARKVGVSKQVCQYRLSNLENNKIILNYHTVPATYRFGKIAYKVYLKLHDINEKKHQEIINFLLKNKDVFWIGECHGKWDLIFGIWAKDMEEFFNAHDKILDKFSKFIQEKELSVSRENIQYNRKWLFSNPNEERKMFNFGEKEEPIKLNDIDLKIIEILVSNSRTRIIDIAEKLNITAEVASYRIKQLEKKYLIKGYKCLFNTKKLGYSTNKAFVYFKNITEQRRKEFLDYCKNHKNIINIVITFAPWDLEIMFETKNYEEYFKIMEEIKNKFSDIIKFYESILINKEPKQIFA
ncbi:Lrp/AsnC family transcriptional regulator [archaeon]|jgi:Lrp/AsnC family transcriptional regulator, leucine-responsive regulatory protein|nr:Lrp/AsnC family transcriptional regulator [archaeon]MBT4241353.1 Lrp/AsnC family transcriptional regulator [archaeon]MBT4418174.1 Lrp/AsnC family transcriptional regulator [archaeon]